MKKFSQEEWIDMHKTATGRALCLGNVHLTKDGAIRSIDCSHACGMCITAYGEIAPQYVEGDLGEGCRRFVIENDGSISLVVGDGEIHSVTGIKTFKFSNPKVIPFKKWLADYIANENRKHKGNESETIYKLDVTGCVATRDMRITGINYDVTYSKCYHGCGRAIHKDYTLSLGRDILTFTYGMVRNDILDEWDSERCGIKAYFDKDFNIVYEDDGGYYINKGYFGGKAA